LIYKAKATVTCTLTEFPYAYGGTLGSTMFNAFDMDSSGNICAGGTSSDSNIVSSSASPILVFYSNVGVIQWAKTYNSISGANTPTNVQAVSFATDNTIGFSIGGGGNMLFFLYDALTGSVLSIVHTETTTSSFSLEPSGMIIDSSGHFIVTG
jgi:hypothetical protein